MVSVKVPVEKQTDGKSCGCQGKNCEVGVFLEQKNALTNKKGSNTYKIMEGLHLDCNWENVIYSITCKKCKKQYVGSCAAKFCTCFSNCCSSHRKFCKGHSVTQVSFHAQLLDGHCGTEDWEIILTEKGRNK